MDRGRRWMIVDARIWSNRWNRGKAAMIKYEDKLQVLYLILDGTQDRIFDQIIDKIYNRNLNEISYGIIDRILDRNFG